MKFILTGCTGFIGSEVLAQCLNDPAITSIVALSRRQLPQNITKNDKLKVVVMKDFTSYPESVSKDISGAEACIWCMGTTEGVKELEYDYPLAFGNAFSPTLAVSAKKFRYIHLSGALVERDQQKTLWLKQKTRRLKGAAETEMLSFAKKVGNEGLWETVIVKAGFVLTKNGKSVRDMLGWVLGSKMSIRVDELAAAMIDVALNGSSEDTLQDCQAMGTRGRDALKDTK